MWKWIAVIVTIGLFAGCGGGTDGQLGVGGDSAASDGSPAALNRYTLANRCFALQSVALGTFVARSDGRYQASAQSLGDAVDFYLKPSALGKYMLYAANQSLLAAASGSTVTFVNAPAGQAGWGVGQSVIWAVEQDAAGRFYLRSVMLSSDAGAYVLAVDPVNGMLTVAASTPGAVPSQRFAFVPANQCTPFPEIATDTEGKTYTGNGVNNPVVGFADVHSHISATGFLGGDHVGRPFSAYGVTVALPDGVKKHGPQGHFDLIGNFYAGTPLAAHDTQGWPTFRDWPAHDMLTYEASYYRWIKRTWKAGLRLLVNNLVQNDALCQLNEAAQIANPSDLQNALSKGQSAVQSLLDGAGKGNCNGMQTAFRQAAFMYRMEDYIDAQSGGPGQGWFRIVTSPEQARTVINRGKLAVVLGVEISNVFNCTVHITVLAGQTVSEQPGCTKAQIKQQLQQLYDLGVRQINLVHEFNNALGGNGIFNGSIINVGNFWDTGSFWQTHDCDMSVDYFYAPGALMLSANPFALLNQTLGSGNPLTTGLSALLNTTLGGTLPVYPTTTRQCNDRDITELGRFAVKQVMAHHMIIDVDHMSVTMKGQVIEMAMKQQPVYPVISSHGGHGGITMQQARDIMRTGGLINPIGVTPKGYLERLAVLKEVTPDGQLLGQSFSSDVNGMAAQPGPSAPKIEYPFTLFQGPGWGPKFDGIAPVTFSMSCVPEGDRCFNYNKEGIAQYGLYADWVEALRIAALEKGNAREVMNAFYSSAEHYLRVWQRARNR